MKRIEIIQISIPIFFLIFFLFLFYKWTLGFTSFTTYSYVLNSAGSLPRKAPTLQLIDQEGQQLTTNNLFQDKYVLINFMYFHCPYVCSATTTKLADLYNKLKNNMPNKITMVSISIDKQHDSDMLNYVWNSYGKPKEWHFVSLSSDITLSLTEKLKHFGVWVYQRPDGFFNHSTYLFLLDPKGNIINSFNVEENTEEIIQTMQRILL